MAQTFERYEDRVQQEAVLDWLENKGKTIVRSRQYSVVDAYVTKEGVLMSVLEVKRRYIDKADESPYKISATKIHKCKQLAKLMNVSLHLIVQWNDCLGMLTIAQDDEFYTEAGGRPARDGAANDYEVMAHIPLDKFTIYDRKP